MYDNRSNGCTHSIFIAMHSSQSLYYSVSFWFCLLFVPWLTCSFYHSRRLSGVVAEGVSSVVYYTKQFTGLSLTCCLSVCLWWWECNEIQFRLHLHITNNTWNNFSFQIALFLIHMVTVAEMARGTHKNQR